METRVPAEDPSRGPSRAKVPLQNPPGGPPFAGAWLKCRRGRPAYSLAEVLELDRQRAEFVARLHRQLRGLRRRHD